MAFDSLILEPMFSPDGRWIAYQSDESGRNEIFVRPFPGPGGKWQVSTDGGVWPTWSRTRHELFYRSGDGHVMASSYGTEGDSFKAEKPRIWSERTIRSTSRQRGLDLHPDGERFAVPEAENEPPRDEVVFVFNLFDELRRIAPPSRK
jgi:serine/threonine-protein kinase